MDSFSLLDPDLRGLWRRDVFYSVVDPDPHGSGTLIPDPDPEKSETVYN